LVEILRLCNSSPFRIWAADPALWEYYAVHELWYEFDSEREMWPMRKLRESFGLAAVHTSCNWESTAVRIVQVDFWVTLWLWNSSNFSRASACFL